MNLIEIGKYKKRIKAYYTNGKKDNIQKFMEAALRKFV